MHMVHRHHMRMRMGDMNAGVEQGNPLYAVNLLHCAGDMLGAGGNLRGKVLRQVFKPDVMVFRNHQGVAFANRVQVQKGQNLRIFIYLVGWYVA